MDGRGAYDFALAVWLVVLLSSPGLLASLRFVKPKAVFCGSEGRLKTTIILTCVENVHFVSRSYSTCCPSASYHPSITILRLRRHIDLCPR
jgi:hypothetical protein